MFTKDAKIGVRVKIESHSFAELEGRFGVICKINHRPFDRYDEPTDCVVDIGPPYGKRQCDIGGLEMVSG